MRGHVPGSGPPWAPLGPPGRLPWKTKSHKPELHKRLESEGLRCDPGVPGSPRLPPGPQPPPKPGKTRPPHRRPASWPGARRRASGTPDLFPSDPCPGFRTSHVPRRARRRRTGGRGGWTRAGRGLQLPRPRPRAPQSAGPAAPPSRPVFFSCSLFLLQEIILSALWFMG